LTTAFSLLLIFAVGLVLLRSTKLTTHAADTSLKLSTKAEHTSAAQVSSCGVWNVVPSPNPGAGADTLNGIARIAGTSQLVTVGTSANSIYGIDQTLIEQWNGTNWNVVSSPNPGTNSGFLRSVARVPRTNQVWAVGYDNTTSNGPYQTLIEFYC
jgi:hypothetical protein